MSEFPTARDLMSHGAVTIPRAASLESAAQILDSENIHGAPVVDATGRLVGVITRSDIVRYVADMPAIPDSVRWGMEGETGTEMTPTEFLERLSGMPAEVSEVMTEELVSAGPAATAGELANLMAAGHVQRVLIMEDGCFLGIVSASDLLKVTADYESRLRR